MADRQSFEHSNVVLARFLSELFDHGRVLIEEGSGVDSPDAMEAACRVLREREVLVAAEFPGTPPTLSVEIAVWAAERFYQACRFVLHRAARDEEVRAALTVASPEGDAAVVTYAIDLTWRFLPDLDRLTASFAPQDCLRAIIRGWGNERPLSSVGMRDMEPANETDLLAHVGLRTLYVDRIIAQQDASRLKNPAVRDLVFAALGSEHAGSLAWCRISQTKPAPLG